MTVPFDVQNEDIKKRHRRVVFTMSIMVVNALIL